MTPGDAEVYDVEKIVEKKISLNASDYAIGFTGLTGCSSTNDNGWLVFDSTSDYSLSQFFQAGQRRKLRHLESFF